MKIQITLVYAGVRKFDFKADDGRQVRGCRVYVVDTDHKADDNFIGYSTTSYTAEYPVFEELYKLQPMMRVVFDAEMTARNEGGFSVRLSAVNHEMTQNLQNKKAA